jgi:hypothetical protein
MSSKARWKTVGIAAVVLVAAAALVIRNMQRVKTVAVVTGAVIAQNKDQHLQRPIGNAMIVAEIAESGTAAGKSVSEVSGLFRVQFEAPVTAGEILHLKVTHPDYLRYAVTMPAGEQIHVVRLTPADPVSQVPPPPGTTRISNVRVRYATRSVSTTTVGTAVRTFDIVNTGNVPCAGHPPCSPNGRWKATVDSLSLDAGENKQFRNVRVSCIAGPCPFTNIQSDRFSRGGREVTVAVRNWSDTVTYLLEAEVSQTVNAEMIRYTYPVTFGRSMNFTLPQAANGPSIEADVDGSHVVFPLGPELRLSWATCRFEQGQDESKQYRCELKPGFRFE